MAASTITLKFSPSEYETVKTELSAQLDGLKASMRDVSANGPRERQELALRSGKLEKIIREI
jgi:hypothetical protein